MSNTNQKHEQQPDQQPTTTPAAQVELTDEELEQVVGGSLIQNGPAGKLQPDPTMVE